MVLICIGIGAIVALVLLAIAVKVAWGIDVFELVSAGIVGISGHSGAGTYRNLQVDAPARQALVAQQTGFTPGTLQAPPANVGAYGPPELTPST